MDRLNQDAAWLVASMEGDEPIRVGSLELNALASCLERRNLSSGSVLYREGACPEGVWAIRKGAVELVVGSAASRRVIQILREGDMVGDPYVLLNVVTPYTARTISEASCLFLSADSYRRLLSECPSLAVAWLRNAAGRLCDARERVTEVLAKGLPQRVARLLLDESVGGRVLLSQRTISQMLGVQRSSINRVLKQFEAQGWVRLRYSMVMLADEEAVRVVASGTKSAALP